MRFGILILAILLSPAAAQTVGPDEEIARRHFDQGKSYYAIGRYDDALQEFEAARQVHPLSAFDFNIGRCLDRMERFAEAVVA